MKTYLIRIAQNNQKKSAAFAEILEQLHETLHEQQIALEIVVFGQSIGFCFSGEESVCEVVIGQIYAMNPDADIIPINDFTKTFNPKNPIITAEIRLNRNDIFPIKTYDEFEGDPLSGVLNVISHCHVNESAWIQLVLKPVKDTGWHNFKLAWRCRFDKIYQIFRIKYWFKKGISKGFEQKIKEKVGRRIYKANLRVAVLGHNVHHRVAPRFKAILGAFQNFNTLDFNQIRALRPSDSSGSVSAFIQRRLQSGFLLSTKEIATIFHLPNEREVPNLLHVLSRKAEPPSDLPLDRKDSTISFFGETNFHGQRVPFGIKRNDRRRHLYTVGKSGSGKSKLLELLIQNDILNGKGVGVLDPHGDLVDNVLRMIPQNRIKDVVVFDPSDLNFPISFNPLADVPPELKIRVTIGFIEIFKKLFGSNWTPRLEHVLRYTTLALLDTPGTTILSILKMLTDKNYRQAIVRNIHDNVVKNFWVNEFAGWSEKFDNEAITPLLNKVGQFVATNMIRNIVGQPENKIDFRHIMDNQKILLMKVSKGILGEENAALMGAIAVTKIYQAAMSRADTREEDRVDFYFYVDEFQNFATDTFDEILSEARKYRLNLTIAHQFLGQLSDKIRTTVFGNVGSMLSFRVGGDDAKILAAEYNPRFSERDIINLGVRDFYCKISIDGELREAFSGRTLGMEFPQKSFEKECLNFSRTRYAKPILEVEEILKSWEEGEKENPKKQEELVSGENILEEDFHAPII